jgi:monoamine oxidase
VIEARSRSRSGGRMYSVVSTKNNTDSAYFDMGPSWIWPGQPLIKNLLKSMKINVFEQYSTGNLIYEDEQGLVRRDYDYSTMAGSLRVDGGMQLIINRLKEGLPESLVLESHQLKDVKTLGDIIIATVETCLKTIQFKAKK